MAKNRIIVFLIRAMAASILFAVYVLICKVVNIDDKGISGVGLLCICIAAIVTPIYHSVSLKLLRLDFGKKFDYFVDQTGAYLFVNYLFCSYRDSLVNKYSIFYTGFEFIGDYIFYLCMYIIGVGIYALACYLLYTIKNKMYGDILKRVLSAVIGFPLYFLAALVPILSWVEWIQIDYVADVAIYLFFAFVAGAVTGVFHFISGGLIKVSYEKMQDHVIFLLFFGIGAILCSTLNSTIGVIKEDFVSGSILLFSVKGLFIYIIGNLVYFIWYNEKKRRKRKKRSIDGSCNEEESKGIDEDLNEDEHGIGNVSSEIILIPGIDEDMEEGKNGSASAGNSGDC